MPLLAYKLLAALLIGLMTILVGLGSLQIIRRHQGLLSLGDALADGIFIGVALFHLVPDAVKGFLTSHSPTAAYGLTILFTAAGFLLLLSLERLLHSSGECKNSPMVAHSASLSQNMSAWIFMGMLFIHAFITGMALGVINQLTTILILFVAIIAHKGFETFALMLNNHHHLKNQHQSKIILVIFSLATPLGTLLASISNLFLQTSTENWMVNMANAFAAGTFLYIGIRHRDRDHFHLPITIPIRIFNNQSLRILVTLIGIVIMSIFIWF